MFREDYLVSQRADLSARQFERLPVDFGLQHKLKYPVTMNDVTQILQAIERGDSSGADSLLPLIYDDLRNLAAARLRKEKPGQTLQATELVHEAFMRLVNGEPNWNSRGHFFGAAAEAMRRIMVERARRKKRIRHGGEMQRVDIVLQDALWKEPVPDNLLELDEALTRLEAAAPERAKLVKLRYFAGLTVVEAAQAMDISVSTAERYWRFARTWLFTEISGAAGKSEPDS